MWNCWNIRSFWCKAGGVLALAVCAALAVAAAAWFGVDCGMDGAVLQALRHHEAGQPLALYRVWHAPLYLQGLAGWMALGGESLLWLRWSAALCFGVGAAFWHLAWRNFLTVGERAALWGAAAAGGGWLLWRDAMLIGFAPAWPVWCCAGAMAWLMVRAARQDNAGWDSLREWSWCGVAAGLIFWCSAPAGAFAVAAILNGTRLRRRVWCAFAGWAVVAALAVFVLGFDPVRQLKAVWWSVSRGGSVREWGVAGVATLWFCWWMAAGWRRKAMQTCRMASAFAGAGWVLVCCIGSPVAMGLGAIPAAALLGRLSGRVGKPILWAGLIVLVLCGGYSLARRPYRWAPHRITTTPAAARGLWISGRDADYFDRLQSAFVRLPGRLMARPVVNATGMAWWELFADARRFPAFGSLAEVQRARPLILLDGNRRERGEICRCDDVKTGRFLALLEPSLEIKGAEQ